MLIRDFYRETFEPLRLRRRSPNTKRLYVSSINSFERFLERAATLADFTDETVSRYLSWFAAQPGGRSPFSANKERSNLLAIWRFACRRIGSDGKPLVPSWPQVEPDIEPQNDPIAWLEHEIGSLFSTVRRLPGQVGKVPANHWWTALHFLLWDTGERIGALMQITWEHIDLDGQWLRVPAEFRKGGRLGATYRLHGDTIAALKLIKGDKPAELVFRWPWSKTYLWNRYAKILVRAGLPADSKSKFHRMRRSVASHAEAMGSDATRLLKHSARRVTLRYLDPRITNGQSASDVLFRPHVPD